MTNVLVTGFEPFGTYTVNASWEAASLFDRAEVEGAAVRALRLPVSYGAAFGRLLEELRSTDPDLVVLTGMAPGPRVRVEKLAVNGNAAADPDNAGSVRRGVLIDPQGPPAYWTGLPAEAIVEALEEAGVPCALSFSAGSYVCNDLFFRFLSYAERQGGRPVGGFVHLPPLARQGPAGQPLETLRQALEVVLATTVRLCS